MTVRPKLLRRIQLQHLLIVFLVLFGILPLVISSLAQVARSRPILEQEEQLDLSRSAEHLSQRVEQRLTGIRRQLVQLGSGLAAMPQAAAQSGWLDEYLRRFVIDNRDQFDTRVTFLDGGSGVFGPELPAHIDSLMLSSLEQVTAASQPQTRYDFIAGDRRAC